MKKDSDTQSSLDDAVNRYVKSMIDFAFGKKGAFVLVIVFFVIVFIMGIGFNGRGESLNSNDEAEKKLSMLISKIEGVESAEVMITYESTSQKVPAGSSIDNIGENNNEGTVGKLLQNSMGNTLIITELEPEIRGVVVVAKGADDYMVKINIIDAVKTVLKVPADRVEVLNMK